jgi:hypothetical protein
MSSHVFVSYTKQVMVLHFTPTIVFPSLVCGNLLAMFYSEDRGNDHHITFQISMALWIFSSLVKADPAT